MEAKNDDEEDVGGVVRGVELAVDDDGAAARQGRWEQRARRRVRGCKGDSNRLG